MTSSTFPTADQIARAIVAAAALTGEDPIECAEGTFGMRCRGVAAEALRRKLPKARRMGVFRCVGWEPCHNAYIKLRQAKRSKWWRDGWVQIVADQIPDAKPAPQPKPKTDGDCRSGKQANRTRVVRAQILDLYAAGKEPEEIADELGLPMSISASQIIEAAKKSGDKRASRWRTHKNPRKRKAAEPKRAPECQPAVAAPAIISEPSIEVEKIDTRPAPARQQRAPEPKSKNLEPDLQAEIDRRIATGDVTKCPPGHAVGSTLGTWENLWGGSGGPRGRPNRARGAE